jgi:hypothetical protein
LLGDFLLHSRDVGAAMIDLLDERVLFPQRRQVDLVIQEKGFLDTFAVGVAPARFDAGFKKSRRLQEDIEKLPLDLVLVDVKGEKFIGDNRAFQFLRDDAERTVARVNAAENELPGGNAELAFGEFRVRMSPMRFI